MQVVDMEVNDVERLSLTKHVFHHHVMRRQRIDATFIQSQRTRQPGTNLAAVVESPLANSVTSWPMRTSSSVKYETTRSVPP
jgi:hypothetical protein